MGVAKWVCLRCLSNYLPVVDASGQDNIVQCGEWWDQSTSTSRQQQQQQPLRRGCCTRPRASHMRMRV
jgi:hypothetical protein